MKEREKKGIAIGMNQGRKDKDKEEGLSLEEAFGQVEGTIVLLEEEDITLEESFRAYQEGMKLLQYCNDKIDKVEKQVLKINEDGGLDEF